MDRADFLAAVDRAFDRIAADLPRWDPPRTFGQSPSEEDYERVTRPERYRLAGARAEAWVEVAVEAGIARVEHDVDVAVWASPPGTLVTCTDVVTPIRRQALPLVLSRSRLADDDVAGLTIGVGRPAHLARTVPFCGCDACDEGSDSVVDDVDVTLGELVLGDEHPRGPRPTPWLASA